MSFEKYSDAEKAEALIRLWVSKYNYEQTAKDTGISEKTLRRWDKDAPKKEIPDLLDRAIQRLLMAIPANMTGNEWSIAIGILMDKWLLIQGEPTSRTEGIITTAKALTPDERDAVLAEAERILASASESRRIGKGGVDGNDGQA